MVNNLNLELNENPNEITWKLANNGQYSAKSAYNMQFEGLTLSKMPTLIWEPCATPKCKSFAWLIIRNWVLTADRLDRCGWQNCGNYKLCNQMPESADHLLFKCLFTIRVWNALKDWLGLYEMEPMDWQAFKWWVQAVHKKGQFRKAMASLAMLVSWEIWKERSTRVFRNHSTSSTVIVHKIKEEAILWSIAGAKALSIVIPRE
jgi:hypothetical protein